MTEAFSSFKCYDHGESSSLLSNIEDFYIFESRLWRNKRNWQVSLILRIIEKFENEEKLPFTKNRLERHRNLAQLFQVENSIEYRKYQLFHWQQINEENAV